MQSLLASTGFIDSLPYIFGANCQTLTLRFPKMPQEKDNYVETELEVRILDSIQRVGWDWRSTSLWFPFRKILGLDVNASDGDIQAAVAGLIRESKFIHVDPEGWRIPNFSPPPDIRGPVLPVPGYLALAYRMPLVQSGPIETALTKERETDEKPWRNF